MDTKPHNKITEKEALYADDAFSEFRGYGKTDKKCPKCGGNFIFDDKVTAYRITCDSCDFQITVRGI